MMVVHSPFWQFPVKYFYFHLRHSDHRPTSPDRKRQIVRESSFETGTQILLMVCQCLFDQGLCHIIVKGFFLQFIYLNLSSSFKKYCCFVLKVWSWGNAVYYRAQVLSTKSKLETSSGIQPSRDHPSGIQLRGKFFESFPRKNISIIYLMQTGSTKSDGKKYLQKITAVNIVSNLSIHFMQK